MRYEKDKKAAKGFPMTEDHSADIDMEHAVKDSTHADFGGKEEHGIPAEDWPKKFVVDGGLKYDFGGPEAHGVEHDIAEIDERAEDGHGDPVPGKTSEYNETKGKIKSYPKKFVVDGRGGFDEGGKED